jgi:hypothetical protein
MMMMDTLATYYCMHGVGWSFFFICFANAVYRAEKISALGFCLFDWDGIGWVARIGSVWILDLG